MKGAKRIKPLLIIMAAIVIAGVVVASLVPLPTTFNLNVSTQVVQATISPQHRVDWHFRNALIYDNYDSPGKLFTGYVRVLPKTQVVFERAGNSPLRIALRSQSAQEPLAELHSSDKTKRDLHQWASIVVPLKSLHSQEGRATVLPVSGDIALGAELSQLSDHPALLLGGRVALLAHSLLGDEKYEAGTAELETGDFVQVKDGTDAHGFVFVGANSDMTGVFRVIARRVEVSRFGAQGYAVYASALNRLKNDTALQLVWAAAVFLLGVLMSWMKRSP